MAKTNLTPVPTQTQRFTADELEALFQKITVCCAGIVAETEAYNSGGSLQRRHIDNITILAQVAGFVADHAGHDCGGYGNEYDWLEIPPGAVMSKQSDIDQIKALLSKIPREQRDETIKAALKDIYEIISPEGRKIMVQVLQQFAARRPAKE